MTMLPPTGVPEASSPVLPNQRVTRRAMAAEANQPLPQLTLPQTSGRDSPTLHLAESFDTVAVSPFTKRVRMDTTQTFSTAQKAMMWSPEKSR